MADDSGVFGGGGKATSWSNFNPFESPSERSRYLEDNPFAAYSTFTGGGSPGQQRFAQDRFGAIHGDYQRYQADEVSRGRMPKKGWMDFLGETDLDKDFVENRGLYNPRGLNNSWVAPPLKWVVGR